MDHDRIDFTSLDPMSDPVRFERMVAVVVHGRRVRPRSAALFSRELLRWGRAAVAIAAALAGAAWLPALARGGGSGAARASDPVELVAEWARAGEVPRDADLMQAFGGGDAR